MPPQTPDPNINSLASLLDEVDFDSGELKNLLLAYATIKKKDAEKSIKAEEKEKNEEKRLFILIKNISTLTEQMYQYTEMEELKVEDTL